MTRKDFNTAVLQVVRNSGFEVESIDYTSLGATTLFEAIRWESLHRCFYVAAPHMRVSPKGFLNLLGESAKAFRVHVKELIVAPLGDNFMDDRELILTCCINGMPYVIRCWLLNIPLKVCHTSKLYQETASTFKHFTISQEVDEKLLEQLRYLAEIEEEE